jgi:tryptophan synthase beta chain
MVHPIRYKISPTPAPSWAIGSHLLGSSPDRAPTTSGRGPGVYTYTLGHDFVPPPIHAGGLRYHGCAPLVGLIRHEGLLDARAYRQTEVFDAGTTFARLQGYLPAPETSHAIRAVIDVAQECKRTGREATIVFNYSGHGLLDLEAYGRYNAGQLRDVEEEDFTAPSMEALSL